MHGGPLKYLLDLFDSASYFVEMFIGSNNNNVAQIKHSIIMFNHK